MTPDRQHLRANLPLALPLTLAVAGALWLVLGQPPLGIDDADIARVYGRNLARGHGLVYTPGHEWVEGYSSPTWMLAWAAAERWTQQPVAWIAGLSVALCALSVGLWLTLARRLAPGRSAGLVTAAFLLTIPGYFAWNTLPLMDLALWSALMLVFLALVERSLVDGRASGLNLGLALALGLLAVTRPEGLALAPTFLGLAAFADWAVRRELGRTLRRHLVPALAVAGSLGALLWVRLDAFGLPLPNTYYAKVSPDRLYNLRQGLEYAMGFVQSVPWMALFAPFLLGVPAVALARVLHGKGNDEQAGLDRGLAFAALCGAVAMIGLALPLVEGGDHFGAHRLLQPFLLPASLPFLFVLGAVHDALSSEQRARLRVPLPAFGIVLAGMLAFSWLSFRLTSNLEREFRIAQAGRALGEALNGAFEGQDLPAVGVVTAGGIALTYEGRVLDLMGLNWGAMGQAQGERYGVKNHAAFNPEVFWTSPPELVTPVLLGRPPRPGQPLINDFTGEVLGDLCRSERFLEAYEPRVLRASRGYLYAYARRDWPSAFEPLPK